MDASIPVFKKPHPHKTVSEWNQNIRRLQTEARLRRSESYELRKQANELRNESGVTTRWDTYINNELLKDRISEVQSWREKQRFTREQVRDEIQALKEVKRTTELFLESLQIPLMISSQCLSHRDQRVPPELTSDQLGVELNEELHTIEKNKRIIIDNCHMAWEKIKDLTNVLCRLEREIQNKDETLTLEYHVKDLNKNSGDISFQLDPTRVPAESMSEESYVSIIENTISIATQLMHSSQSLRANMFAARSTADNQLVAARQSAETALRQRVHSIECARNELQWQQYQLESQMQTMEREIESLRAAIADKINPTKLVETRLEMRARRPVLERVQDIPMRGLIEEFERVHLSTSKLEQKLKYALTTYHGMFNHHQRVTKDLEYKNQALETDRQLIEIRKPLHFPETQFQRNVGYCNMRDQLPRSEFER